MTSKERIVVDLFFLFASFLLIILNFVLPFSMNIAYQFKNLFFAYVPVPKLGCLRKLYILVRVRGLSIKELSASNSG